jgi:choice-of-anchor A domain-containing protein
MRHWTAGIFAAIASLAAAATAEAASIPITSVTPSVLLPDFNVIVEEDFSNTTDVQYPVMVGCPATGCVSTEGLHSTGGPLNSSGVVLGSTPGTTGIIGYGEVNVFSNVLSGTTASVNGSVTYVGGAYSGTLTGTGTGSMLGGYIFPPGATVANNPATFQTYIWSPLTTLSGTTLPARTPNSMFTVTATGGTFTPGPMVMGTTPAVFSVMLSQLENLSPGSLTFAGCLVAATPCDAVVNVVGAGTLNNGSLAFPGSADHTNILFNFENDVNITVTNSWTVSILDPLGSVVGMHQIDGGVVAMNFTTSDEVHGPGFDCSDGLCGPSNIPFIPEPGTLALLGSALTAFAAIVVIRRRGGWVGPGRPAN